MSDTPDNLPDVKITPFDITARTLARPVDETLLWDATRRGQQSQQLLHTLIALAPRAATAIRELLRHAWNLDGDQVGVISPPTQQRSTRQCSLSQACGFVLQNPQLSPAQFPACRISRMPAQHPFASLSAIELFERCKALALKPFMQQRWDAYWQARAPGSGVSRHERAAQLYGQHLEAATHHIEAVDGLTPPLLNAVQTLMDPTAPVGTLIDGRRIHTEQVALKHPGQVPIALPGAWIITLDGEDPVPQLLYLPAWQPAVQLFHRRTHLERWLIDNQQAVFQVDRALPRAMIDYIATRQPLQTGIAQRLSDLANHQFLSVLSHLSHHHDISEHAIHTLDNALAFDEQLSRVPLLAAPPEVSEQPPDMDALKTTAQFGWLYADIPPATRQAMIDHQHQAIETLLGEDYQGDHRHPPLVQLTQHLEQLHNAQSAASDAAVALLARRVYDTASLDTHYTALYRARNAGLRAEALLQRSLGQLGDDELNGLLALLEDPELEDRTADVGAARLTLAVRRHNGSSTLITEKVLKGPVLIARRAALRGPGTDADSLLLYWPGRGGALQRFDSRRALEQYLFGIQAGDPHLALRLDEVTSDPFEYSLQSQQTDFEEQAARIRAEQADAQSRDSALQRLRLEVAGQLCVPEHQARDAAFEQIIEQNNSSHLAEHLPQWLQTLNDPQRTLFKYLVQAYLPAAQRAQALLERSLPQREAFARQQIEARLRRDFSLKKNFTVVLDLPDSVRAIRDVIPGAAPGTPVRMLNAPSAIRSKLSLETLALSNIGDSMGARLSFMRLEVTADDQREYDTLKNGITGAYLARVVSELDLAQQYEIQILRAFNGSPEQSRFDREYQRECLIEPLRLTLQLHATRAHLQGHINDNELHTLKVAIDADTPQAWEVDRKQIVLLPAGLAVGGADTNQRPTALVGVTFIQEKNSGVTLVYLPDAPDHRNLLRADSLDQARALLFALCAQDSGVDYLAGRTLKGDVIAHAARIRKAYQSRYDGLIGVGSPWPSTTSLAAHELDSRMARLIEAHRNTSRSNFDLAVERYALQNRMLFHWIKVALNCLPFVGTAISLYDARANLHAAVKAFLRGDIGQGIDDLASAFEALLFATMDAAQIAGASTQVGKAARGLMRRHQLSRRLDKGAFWRSGGPAKKPSRRSDFEGYAYDQPLSLEGLHAPTSGKYRQVYRHARGEFIVRQGQILEVTFDSTYDTWRLKGNRNRLYRQPIALDEASEWQSHGILYGRLVAGGLPGGSRRIPRRRAGAPPAAVEAQLPQEMTRTLSRRQIQLNEIAVALDDLLRQSKASNTELSRYTDAWSSHTPAERFPLSQDIDVQLFADIELAKQTYQLADNATQLPGGGLLATLNRDKNTAALVITERALQRAQLAGHRLSHLTRHLDDLNRQINRDHPGTEHLRLAREITESRGKILAEYTIIEASINDIRLWRPRVAPTPLPAGSVEAANVIMENFSELRLLITRTSLHLQSARYLDVPHTLSWFYLYKQVGELHVKLNNTLVTHMELPRRGISRVERNRVLNYCSATYEEARQSFNSWSINYPELFDPHQVQPLRDNLETLSARALKARRKTSTEQAADRPHKTFNSEGDELLVGTEEVRPDVSQRRYIRLVGEGRRETWDQVGQSQKYRRVDAPGPSRPAPPAAPANVAVVLEEARGRLGDLPAYEAKVHSYRNMEPVNLEHMMASEADGLVQRARHLENLGSRDPLIAKLREQAMGLQTRGRDLRTERSLTSQQPTEGYLDDLKTVGKIDIQKLGSRESRPNRLDGGADFLQEYVINDLTKNPPVPLWYAHFHYDARASAFDSFIKAHLKLGRQRKKGLQWQLSQQEQGALWSNLRIWRGDIGKAFAVKHFEAL
ncbi:dermonecrotic toxin domain-containing protein [Pseudomonas sp. Z18(2022)]|uniref:dermonecrotic toxin domain-containing protein n=1 Tax=Pseudomonas sp. Z18(2022) TaxID=2983410 RepID=UPI002E8227ED|nr:DUF6543 domain-containing protein [Pseudomonas sp. Z18(2022)]